MRDKLQSLPAEASAKALSWLQDISFTGTDLDVLRVDDAGNVFGLSNYHSYYSPALVYYNNMAGGINAGTETYIAEAAAHEFGHNLGLSHDGTTTGTTYYAGHGSGLVSWAPIMGVGYYNNVTQWSKDEVHIHRGRARFGRQPDGRIPAGQRYHLGTTPATTIGGHRCKQ